MEVFDFDPGLDDLFGSLKHNPFALVFVALWSYFNRMVSISI